MADPNAIFADRINRATPDQNLVVPQQIVVPQQDVGLQNRIAELEEELQKEKKLHEELFQENTSTILENFSVKEENENLRQEIARLTVQQPEKENPAFSNIFKQLGERITDLEKTFDYYRKLADKQIKLFEDILEEIYKDRQNKKTAVITTDKTPKLSKEELTKKYEYFWKEACKNLEFFPTQEEFNFSKNSYFKYNPSGCDVEGMEKQIYAHIQNIKKTTEQKKYSPKLEYKEDNGSSTVGERLEARNGSIPPIDPFCMEIPTPTEAEKSEKKEEKDEVEESKTTQLEDSSLTEIQEETSPPPVEEEEKREEKETESESSKTAASEKEERAQKKEQDKKKEEKKKENQEKKKEGGRKRKK